MDNELQTEMKNTKKNTLFKQTDKRKTNNFGSIYMYNETIRRLLT